MKAVEKHRSPLAEELLSSLCLRPCKLAKLGVGLNAYQLDAPTAGYLLEASLNWTDTTNYTDTFWQASWCTNTTAPLLGAGSLIRAWFQQQN
jgi:hypothetical protein